MRRIFFLISILSIFAACNNDDTPETDPTVTPETIAAPVQLSYNIANIYPHDTSAFTQGLYFYNGKLYEGTGEIGTSSLRITDIKTGKVEKKHVLSGDDIFGEGITILNNKIYQLTWLNNIVYVYDIKNIDQPIQTFKWPYQGWGITHNGTDLIISDGSANIYFVNPNDFKVKSTLQVRDNNGPVSQLNELEYIDGYLYANVWQTDSIIKIDPQSGHIVGKMDLPNLLNQYAPNEIIPGKTDVLNGIAYDSSSKKLYITGKRWPKLFELTLN